MAFKYKYQDCFVFSDYLMWCGYALQLDPIGSDGAVYQVAQEETKIKIADSFTAFLQQYLIDSDELL